MARWKLKSPHKRFLVHSKDERLVVLGLDGYASWCLGQETEAIIRQQIEDQWTQWRDLSAVASELYQLGLCAAKEVLKQNEVQSSEHEGTSVSALLIICDGERVNIARAGFFDVCLLREGLPIRHSVSQIQRAKLAEMRELCPRTATVFDFIYTGNLLGDLNRQIPMQLEPPWSLVCGDELIVADHLFFTGVASGPEELAHLQNHSDLDWSQFNMNERQTSVLRLALVP